MKNKKPLFITLVSIDVAITIFLFVISILMLANASKDRNSVGGLIGFLMNHPMVYGFAFVVPLFVLLAGNIVGLVIYVKKSAKKNVKVQDLSDEEKEALKKEILKDLQGGDK